MKKMLKKIKFIIAAIILIFVGMYYSFWIARVIRIETRRELVFEVDSPNNLSNFKIYRRGGKQEIWFSTPMEIECSNNFGSITKRIDLKNGHLIEREKDNQIVIQWNEEENGGNFHNYKNIPVDFFCKSNKEL